MFKNVNGARTQVYTELLLLNHWVVVSYCGFSKILKKHDRWTGFMTKEKVRGDVVAAPFLQVVQSSAFSISRPMTTTFTGLLA